MAEANLKKPETYTLDELDLSAGEFFAYFDPENEMPFGPVRQMISKERGGGYIVSAIYFDHEKGEFARIDELHGKPFRAIPLISNVLPPFSESETKAFLLRQAVSLGQITAEEIGAYLEKPIPERIVDK